MEEDWAELSLSIGKVDGDPSLQDTMKMSEAVSKMLIPPFSVFAKGK